MKIYISYYWNIRNFAKNAIPISTSRSDPAYYHDFKGNRHQYIDRRGIYNGLRCEMLAPGDQLSGLCLGTCEIPNADCAFLTGYREQLDKIDFNDFIKRTETLCNKVADYVGITDPVAVFIVHEAPSNLCSERGVLFDWFAENGVQVEEYPVPVKRSAKPKRQEVYNF